MFGQLTTAVQFYLYGRRHFTATGWQRAAARYNPSDLDTLDLDARTYLVTGANSGIGLTLSKYLARRGATLFMVCRNPERAARARDEVAAEAKDGSRVHTVICDCGLDSDVRKAVKEVGTKARSLDGVVCNAGALLNSRTLTPAGHEVTYATHLLHGSYLLTLEAMPLLRKVRPADVTAPGRGRGGAPP